MALRKSQFCLVLLMGAIGYIQLITLLMRADFQQSDHGDDILKDVNRFNRPGARQVAIFPRGIPLGINRNFTHVLQVPFHPKNTSSNINNTYNAGYDEGKVKSNKKVTKEVTLDKKLDAERPYQGNSGRCPRRVHLWAGRAGELGFAGGTNDIKCPGSDCDVQLTVDMSLETLQKNEALVLFHWSSWDWDTMHSHRPRGQKWVFYTLESPRNTRKNVIPPDKYYNTTYDYIMTFRYDSDFRADYGQYRAGKPQIDAGDTRNWAENRSKLVVWMASNCKGTTWPRQDFVTRLARYIPVDMYGRCGNLTCKSGTEDCSRALKQHKFYLALENSECSDYITEKFWITALFREIVPVVFGPPRSDYEKVAPPNSFIHISDFATTRELAEYLQKVDADDALYNTYFEWKKKGSLKPYGTGPNIMCQLGDRLAADEKAVKNGTYKPSKQKDWKTWWLDSCKSKGKVPD